MNIIPIAKCEYVVWKAPGSVDPARGGEPQVEFRYDTTLVWEDTPGTVKISLLDKRTGMNQWITVVASGIAKQPTGCILQFGAYIVVSLYDAGTYITWPLSFNFGNPAATPPVAPSIPGFTLGGPNGMELLGLDLCPTPSTYDFPKTLTGDLLVLAGQRVAGNNDIVLEYQSVQPNSSATVSTDEYANNVIVRLPIAAQYWRSGWLPPVPTTGPMEPDAGNLMPESQAIVNTGLIPRWKIANQDVQSVANSITAISPTNPDFWASSRQHLMHRGYFYRFAFIRQFTDGDGNPVQQRSNPSVDLFVPAVNYSPFFWSALGRTDMEVPAGTPGFPQQIMAAPSNDFWATDQATSASYWGNGSGIEVPPPTPVPNPGAWLDLQKKYRNYFGDLGVNDSNGAGNNGDAMQWAAQWLGWRTQGNSTNNTDYNHQPPWICDVSTEQLLSAPQTIFNWSDFGFTRNPDGTYSLTGTNGEIISIEVYRTAYEDVDPVARPVTTPLFQPHTYGLVGTIAPGESFTDTTKIPDFGQDPGEFEGYLRGQFSGDVAIQYGQSPALVLGNVTDDYSVFGPSPIAVQAFLIELEGQVQKTNLTDGPFADGFPTRQYFFAYVDTNGFRSAFAPIAIDTSTTASSGGVAFTFPYGYDPNIANIELWVGVWVGTQRLYGRLATVPPEPGQYYDEATEPAETATALPTPGGTNGSHRFYEPGAIIYSLPDAPWDWPQSQAEKHSSEFPVRGLMEMMGELAVLTDSSYTLTLLRSADPRSERETQQVGLITKNAIVKVEDATCILSQHGVYFLVPSRAEELPSNIEVKLLAYLTETIPALLPLTDLRRASMGYLARRKEIWLHIPSSINLWPKLPDVGGALTVPNPKAQPQMTLMFGLKGSIRSMDNYTFDIDPSFEIKNLSQTIADRTQIVGPDRVDIETYNPTPVLFCAGSDGGLFASYCDRDGRLVTLDLDAPEVDYDGAAYGTLAMGLEEPSGQKQIERTEALLEARGQVQIVTGIPKQYAQSPTDFGLPGGTSLLAGWDAIRGFIHDAARVFNIRNVYPDQQRKYNHPGSGSAIETKGSTVMVRVRTTPDAQGRHKVTINGLTVYYDQKHQHG